MTVTYKLLYISRGWMQKCFICFCIQ